MQHFEQNKNMVQTADGNIHLLDNRIIKSGEHYHDMKLNAIDKAANGLVGYGSTNEQPLLYTTDPSLKGVKQLPREMFVREGKDPLTEMILSYHGFEPELSLPQSLTIEDDKVTKLKWE